MTDLKFGITLFPQQWQDVTRIEEMGYDSAWTSEHIFFYFPTFDALTALAAMAARTTRIQLGTAVLLLPLRPAALAAKEIASVDIISGGRVIVGVGVGGEYPKEFEAVGVPVKERGARTDESIRVMKRLFSEDNVTFGGRFTQLNGVTPRPLFAGPPSHQPCPGPHRGREGGARPGKHRRRHLPVHRPRRHLRRGPRHRRRRPLPPLQPALQERRRPLRRHGQRRRLRP